VTTASSSTTTYYFYIRLSLDLVIRSTFFSFKASGTVTVIQNQIYANASIQVQKY